MLRTLKCFTRSSERQGFVMTFTRHWCTRNKMPNKKPRKIWTVISFSRRKSGNTRPKWHSWATLPTKLSESIRQIACNPAQSLSHLTYKTQQSNWSRMMSIKLFENLPQHADQTTQYWGASFTWEAFTNPSQPIPLPNQKIKWGYQLSILNKSRASLTLQRLLESNHPNFTFEHPTNPLLGAKTWSWPPTSNCSARHTNSRKSSYQPRPLQENKI